MLHIRISKYLIILLLNTLSKRNAFIHFNKNNCCSFEKRIVDRVVTCNQCTLSTKLRFIDCHCMRSVGCKSGGSSKSRPRLCPLNLSQADCQEYFEKFTALRIKGAITFYRIEVMFLDISSQWYLCLKYLVSRFNIIVSGKGLTGFNKSTAFSDF